MCHESMMFTQITYNTINISILHIIIELAMKRARIFDHLSSPFCPWRIEADLYLVISSSTVYTSSIVSINSSIERACKVMGEEPSAMGRCHVREVFMLELAINTTFIRRRVWCFGFHLYRRDWADLLFHLFERKGSDTSFLSSSRPLS